MKPGEAIDQAPAVQSVGHAAMKDKALSELTRCAARDLLPKIKRVIFMLATMEIFIRKMKAAGIQSSRHQNQRGKPQPEILQAADPQGLLARQCLFSQVPISQQCRDRWTAMQRQETGGTSGQCNLTESSVPARAAVEYDDDENSKISLFADIIKGNGKIILK